MTPTMLARLKAATDYVMAEARKNTDAALILTGLVRDHAATYRSGAGTLRCAGVTASCTWSSTTGLLDAWRKNASIKLSMEG